ncbi:MAG: putative Ig domain-containing protein, partial [Lachnospiraceae bacterium]|nr:putative Ig domain-containing protein [Lachnospiraceae bacterium]
MKSSSHPCKDILSKRKNSHRFLSLILCAILALTPALRVWGAEGGEIETGDRYSVIYDAESTDIPASSEGGIISDEDSLPPITDGAPDVYMEPIAPDSEAGSNSQSLDPDDEDPGNMVPVPEGDNSQKAGTSPDTEDSKDSAPVPEGENSRKAGTSPDAEDSKDSAPVPEGENSQDAAPAPNEEDFPGIIPTGHGDSLSDNSLAPIGNGGSTETRSGILIQDSDNQNVTTLDDTHTYTVKIPKESGYSLKYTDTIDIVSINGTDYQTVTIDVSSAEEDQDYSILTLSGITFSGSSDGRKYSIPGGSYCLMAWLYQDSGNNSIGYRSENFTLVNGRREGEPGIITNALPNYGLGMAYEFTLEAEAENGGAITWSIASSGNTGIDRLPKGLTLNPTTGVISGTTTEVSNIGTWQIFLNAKEEGGGTARKWLRLSNAKGDLTLTPNNLYSDPAHLRVSYNQIFKATNKSEAANTLKWSYSGTLPEGLSFTVSSNGDEYILSGTPKKNVGEYPFTITVYEYDAENSAVSFGLQKYYLNVEPEPVTVSWNGLLSLTSTVPGEEDVDYSLRLLPNRDITPVEDTKLIISPATTEDFPSATELSLAEAEGSALSSGEEVDMTLDNNEIELTFDGETTITKDDGLLLQLSGVTNPMGADKVILKTGEFTYDVEDKRIQAEATPISADMEATYITVSVTDENFETLSLLRPVLSIEIGGESRTVGTMTKNPYTIPLSQSNVGSACTVTMRTPDSTGAVQTDSASLSLLESGENPCTLSSAASAYYLELVPEKLKDNMSLYKGDTLLTPYTRTGQTVYRFSTAPDESELKAIIHSNDANILETYNLQDASVTMSQETITVNVASLAKTASLSGTVYGNPKGNSGTAFPLKGAEVRATQTVNNITYSYSAVTKTDGTYSLTDLYTGIDTKVHISSPGFDPITDYAISGISSATYSPTLSCRGDTIRINLAKNADRPKIQISKDSHNIKDLQIVWNSDLEALVSLPSTYLTDTGTTTYMITLSGESLQSRSYMETTVSDGYGSAAFSEDNLPVMGAFDISGVVQSGGSTKLQILVYNDTGSLEYLWNKPNPHHIEKGREDLYYVAQGSYDLFFLPTNCPISGMTRNEDNSYLTKTQLISALSQAGYTDGKGYLLLENQSVAALETKEISVTVPEAFFDMAFKGSSADIPSTANLDSSYQIKGIVRGTGRPTLLEVVVPYNQLNMVQGISVDGEYLPTYERLSQTNSGWSLYVDVSSFKPPFNYTVH